MKEYQSVLPAFMRARAEDFAQPPANCNPVIRNIFTAEEMALLADYVQPFLRAGIVDGCVYAPGGQVSVFTARHEGSPTNLFFLLKDFSGEGCPSYIVSIPGVLPNTQTINFGEAMRLLDRKIGAAHGSLPLQERRRGLSLV